MKVLLISIHSVMDIVYPAAHLGFYRIASFLRNNGIAVDVGDLEIDDLEPYLQKIRQGEYDVIGFSVSTSEMEKDLDLLLACKEAAKHSPKKCIMVAGGQQAALNSRQWLAECGIDVCILGYGERPMLALCSQLMDQPDAEIPELCQGMQATAFLDRSGKLVFQPQEPTTQEEFEFLNYDCMLKADIPYERYWQYNEERIKSLDFNRTSFKLRNIRIYSTSHCPLRCAFCSSQFFLTAAQGSRTQKIVMLSAEKIHALILHTYKKHRSESYFFGCDNFIISKQGRERVRELSGLIIHSKEIGELPKDMLFHCMARVDSFVIKHGKERLVDFDLLKVMSQAGFVNISTGVETFSDRLLQAPSVNKLQITSKECVEVVDAILAAGMVPQILLILGIPESTPEELLYTMKVAAEFILKGAQVASTTYLFADYGAPITQDKNYTYDRREWKNPYTGQIIKINDKVHALDSRIAKVIDHFETASDAEIARLRKHTPWGDGILPRFFVSLATFIGIAKLLENDEMVEHLESVFEKRCRQELSA